MRKGPPMPDVSINVGGRAYQVSCQPGEEHFLRAAAAILDAEAQPLQGQLGRLPEARLLLMTALLVADKAAAQDDELRQLRARLAGIEAQGPVTVEVPVIPATVGESLAGIAARVEALAGVVEEMAAPIMDTVPDDPVSEEISDEDADEPSPIGD